MPQRVYWSKQRSFYTCWLRREDSIAQQCTPGTEQCERSMREIYQGMVHAPVAWISGSIRSANVELHERYSSRAIQIKVILQLRASQNYVKAMLQHNSRRLHHTCI